MQIYPTKLVLGSREFSRVKWAKVWLSIGTTDIVVVGRGFLGKPKKERRYGADHLGVRWDFLIVLDGADGLEGADNAELDLEFSAEFDGRNFPASLEAVAGAKLTEGEASNVCTYYGIDGPDLVNNQFEFREWIDRDHISVRWSAEVRQQGKKRAPFLFEGVAEFEGIQMAVRREEEASAFLSRILPALDQSQLHQWWGPEVAEDDKIPVHERLRSVIWERKIK